jgi:acyl carrier protein
MDDLRGRLRGYLLATFLPGKPDAALRDDASLEGSHILDSAQTLELVAFLERAFGIVVEPDDAVPENLDSVDALVAFVRRKQGAAG